MIQKRVTSDGVISMPFNVHQSTPIKCVRDQYIPMVLDLSFFRNKDEFVLYPSDADSISDNLGNRFEKAEATVKVFVDNKTWGLAYTLKASSVADAVKRVCTNADVVSSDIRKIQWIGHIG